MGEKKRRANAMKSASAAVWVMPDHKAIGEVSLLKTALFDGTPILAAIIAMRMRLTVEIIGNPLTASWLLQATLARLGLRADVLACRLDVAYTADRSTSAPSDAALSKGSPNHVALWVEESSRFVDLAVVRHPLLLELAPEHSSYDISTVLLMTHSLYGLPPSQVLPAQRGLLTVRWNVRRGHGVDTPDTDTRAAIDTLSPVLARDAFEILRRTAADRAGMRNKIETTYPLLRTLWQGRRSLPSPDLADIEPAILALSRIPGQVGHNAPGKPVKITFASGRSLDRVVLPPVDPPPADHAWLPMTDRARQLGDLPADLLPWAAAFLAYQLHAATLGPTIDSAIIVAATLRKLGIPAQTAAVAVTAVRTRSGSIIQYGCLDPQTVEGHTDAYLVIRDPRSGRFLDTTGDRLSTLRSTSQDLVPLAGLTGQGRDWSINTPMREIHYRLAHDEELDIKPGIDDDRVFEGPNQGGVLAAHTIELLRMFGQLDRVDGAVYPFFARIRSLIADGAVHTYTEHGPVIITGQGRQSWSALIGTPADA